MENTEILSMGERGDNFEIIEEFLEEENHVFEVGKEFKEVIDDRDLMVDAFALLGGNENLVQQMIHRLVDTDYSPSEDEFIRLSTSQLWGEDLLTPSPFNLGHLLGLMTPLHQDRLPRILAKALLFCGRYNDTKLFSSQSHPNSHILLISLSNFPGSDLPLGRTPCGRSCSRLAILYHWASPEIRDLEHQRKEKAKGPLEAAKARGRVRTISTSLAMEIKMLSITDVFAILPCP
eukprot:TRINITY_DN15480_c0_g1_i2.p1 TRINITY_DN15480_c0_g1~~TRINITY_DN15480_c0_g1_i2.p1  ORF type:complete len:234 (-),score=80.75 TRINITY_DN15480_c0_g1_i2:136-837(-)